MRTAILAIFIIASVAAPISAKEFVVVIDAGHGGHDHGAPGKTTDEKTVNLNVALKLGDMLKKNMKDVKIVYTRNSDTFVTLQNRADIANKAGGDLFVSIHANSVDKTSKKRTTISGASVYTLGLDRSDANLEVAMRENAVMKLEKDYSTKYQGFDPNSAESYIIFEMSQNKHMQHSIDAAQAVQRELISTAGRQDHGVRQANFWVLLKTAMPAILVELDFICNPTQEQFMASQSGQTKLAKAICNGISAYRHAIAPNKPDSGKTKTCKSQNTDKSETKTTCAATGTTVYKIQIFSTPRKLANGATEFKGLNPVDYYCEDNSLKYTYGEYSSQASASTDLKKVRKLFPDAFIVKMQDGRRIK